jgi:hypothetical protein
MTLSDIARLRLHHQLLLDTKLNTAKEVVAYMGAMQAQDYAMSKWAVGIRMKKGAEKEINKALDKGEILRTHILRPTWHLVFANDIYWMLALTAPRIKASLKSRHKELGLSEALVKKSHRILEKALSNGDHVSREALVKKLQAGKIDTTENRASHLLFCAELEGILCSGAGKQTYALLEQRVPKKNLLSKEESLARLAGIYFKSRSPATLTDFTWWSGLSPADARNALEMIKTEFTRETIGEQTYWFSPAYSGKKSSTANLLLLPAFDEFLISYKDRTAAIQLLHQKRAFSSNGIFWPTLLLNGQVTGLWKRTVKNDQVLIEPDLFETKNKIPKALLKTATEAFGHFLDKSPQIL